MRIYSFRLFFLTIFVGSIIRIEAQENSFQRIFSITNQSKPSNMDVLLQPAHPTVNDSIAIIVYTTSLTADSRHSTSIFVDGNTIEIKIKTIASIALAVTSLVDTFLIGKLSDTVYTLKVTRERRVNMVEENEIFAPSFSSISYFKVGGNSHPTQPLVQSFSLNTSEGNESLLIAYRNYPGIKKPSHTLTISNDTLYSCSRISYVYFTTDNQFFDTISLSNVPKNKTYVLKHCLRDTTGCHSWGYCFWGADTTFSFKLQSLDKSDIAVEPFYPNPVKDYILLDSQYLNQRVEIYNSSGVLVFQGVYSEPINTVFFSSGIYFLKVANEIMKFVKP